MKIKRTIYSKSVLMGGMDTRYQVLMEAEHEGKTGHLRIDGDMHKRDLDEIFYCDIPGITIDDIDGHCDIWSMKPEHTIENEEVRATINHLANYKL